MVRTTFAVNRSDPFSDSKPFSGSFLTLLPLETDSFTLSGFANKHAYFFCRGFLIVSSLAGLYFRKYSRTTSLLASPPVS